LKFTGILLAKSFILTNSIALLDEGIQSFKYFKHRGDWVALLVYTFLFLLLPLLIFFMGKKSLNLNFRISSSDYINNNYTLIVQKKTYFSTKIVSGEIGFNSN
jgi:hypothetical protein